MTQGGRPLALPAETMAVIRRAYFEECESHLGDLERGLTALAQGEADDPTLVTTIRAAHSIKGGAGLFGLNHVVALARLIEHALETARADRAWLSADALRHMSTATHSLAGLIAAANANATIEPDVIAPGEAEVAALLAPATPQTPSDALDELAFTGRPMDLGAFGPRGEG